MLNNIDIQDINKIALESGKAILEIYNREFSVEYKDDNSPLTEADTKANKIICDSLEKLYPEIPILSEENTEVDYEVRKNWNYYWCVDPIDGTKEFIKKNGEFTVNIALIHKNYPVLGVVFIPVLGDIYYAKKGKGAFKNGDRLPLKKGKKLDVIKVIVSNSKQPPEIFEFIKTLRKKDNYRIDLILKGSSLKFCMVAEGEVDIHPKFSPIREWDTAASHSILLESGKNILHYQTGKQIIYNKKNLLHPWFIAK